MMKANSFKSILDACRKYNRFVVVSHHNPDADAAASSLAMALFLKSLGKKVTVLNEDNLAEWMGFFPHAKLFKRAKDFKAKSNWYDAAIVLDCGDFRRIGLVAELLDPTKPVINIDHHITNDKFGQINLVDAKASSTCEILFEIFKAARCRLTKAMSVLLYSGIMTDTGSFRFENTTAKALSIAAELMEFGIPPAEMHHRLYPGIPVKDMRQFTEVIHQAKLLLNDKVYCVSLDGKTMQSFSKKFDLKEKLFAFLRTVEGIELVVILTQVNSKETRVNLRSQGEFDVARLASQFDGGGHRKAAGAKIYDGLEAAEKKIMAAIKLKLK
jgi:bifunctional oligoribonuclease and PAP phosphatase NrnA